MGRVHIFMMTTDQKRLSFLLIIVKIEVLNTFIDFEFLGVDLGSGSAVMILSLPPSFGEECSLSRVHNRCFWSESTKPACENVYKCVHCTGP